MPSHPIGIQKALKISAKYTKILSIFNTFNILLLFVRPSIPLKGLLFFLLFRNIDLLNAAFMLTSSFFYVNVKIQKRYDDDGGSNKQGESQLGKFDCAEQRSTTDPHLHRQEI